MASKEYPLSLVIRAINEASGPLKQVSDSVERATKPIRDFQKQMAGFAENSGVKGVWEGFGRVGSALGNVGKEALAFTAKLVGIAAAAGFAFYHVVRGSVDAGDKLSEVSSRVGLTVDGFASLGFAMAQSDVDAEQFSASMDQFNKRLGEAKAGGGPLLEFLNKVSPALGRQVKAAKSTEEALALMTDAFEKLPDSQRRSALSAAAFGKSGLQMGEALHQGGAAVQALQARFMELSGSQKAFADNASVLDNTMRELETAFEGTKNAALGELFPALNELTKALTKLVSENREKLVAWAKELGAVISAWVKDGGPARLAEQIGALITRFADLTDKVGGAKGVMAVILAIMAAPLLSAIVGLVPAVFSLAVSLITLNTAAAAAGVSLGAILATGGVVVVALAAVGAAVYELYTHWDELAFIVKDFWNGLVSQAQQAWEAVRPILQFFGKALAGTGLGSALDFTVKTGDSASKWAGENLYARLDQNQGRLGVAAPSAAVAPPNYSTEPTRVEVVLTGAAPGTRVKADKNASVEVNYSMGLTQAGN